LIISELLYLKWRTNIRHFYFHLLQRMDLYVDAEWYINQNIFLIGYAYSDHHFKVPIKSGQHYGKMLTRKAVLQLLKPVKKNNCIFFYGPDIGMLEKTYNIKIREKYLCVNLLKVFKDLYPNLSRYKLCDFEERFGYSRKTMKYKQSIFQVFADWKDPKKKKIVMQYNQEDVISLAKIKKRVWKEFTVTKDYLEEIRLK